MRSFKDYSILFFKGMGMGAADVVPGVSGGTIAFITGIYEELINSIKSVNGNTFTLLLRLKLGEFWKSVNGGFLLSVVFGIFVSILSLAKLISYLLESHPIKVWSFFFGLVVISAITILREIRKWSVGVVFMLLLGIVIAYYITIASPASTPNDWWYVLLSGAIAICAMILPGISGAFILLILGKYEYVTGALHEMNLPVIAIFIAGCLIGLLSFVRVISWVLKKYYFMAVALLSGFMIGSLNKVWPWKEVIAFRVDSEGNQIALQEQSVLPTNFMELTGNSPEMLQALFFMAIGIGIVVIVEKFAQSNIKD